MGTSKNIARYVAGFLVGVIFAGILGAFGAQDFAERFQHFCRE